MTLTDYLRKLVGVYTSKTCLSFSSLSLGVFDNDIITYNKRIVNSQKLHSRRKKVPSELLGT